MIREFTAFELEQQQDVKDEMAARFDDLTGDLRNMYIGDEAVPDMLGKIEALNDEFKDYENDLKMKGYRE